MRGVNDNWNERVKSLRLTVDQDKARALGVTSQNIAVAARTVLSGTTVGQYREGDKLIDIVLRQPAEERNADHRSVHRVPADGERPRDPAIADCQLRVCVGAGRDLARGAQVRGDGAG